MTNLNQSLTRLTALAVLMVGIAATAHAADEDQPKPARQTKKSAQKAAGQAAKQPVANRSFGEPVVYKKVDGRELRAFVVKPADWKASDSRPAIVFFHGGGWRGGGPGQFEHHSEHLAKRGMVCVNVEYRLLKGDTKDPPIICIEDAKSAMRWTRSHAAELGIDPNRIAASGGSAGGHLAAFVGMVDGFDDKQDDTKVSARANALVLFNPVIDNSKAGFGNDRVGDRVKEFSPAHNVTSTAPPTIIFVGSLDRLITPAMVEKFRSEMKAAEVRCDAHVYDGQEHGFFNFSNTKYYELTLGEADKFLTSLGWLPAQQSSARPQPAQFSVKDEAGEENDPELHADGDGWRLQKARVVDKSLPRVLLIGDSILNGYLQEVSKSFEGKAYVDAWVTPTNQANKQLPRILGEILAQGPYRVVHFNLGLHGWQPGRIPAGQFKPLTTQMVEALSKQAPQTTLIWASTTPVTKQGMPGKLEPEINPIIVEHNRLAAEVMAEQHVAIDDLYNVMMPQLKLARGDKYHWSAEGRTLQAQAVVKSIRAALETPAK